MVSISHLKSQHRSDSQGFSAHLLVLPLIVESTNPSKKTKGFRVSGFTHAETAFELEISAEGWFLLAVTPGGSAMVLCLSLNIYLVPVPCLEVQCAAVEWERP